MSTNLVLPPLKHVASPKGCCVEGCTAPRDARGMCKLHYNRWKRHGDPLAGRTKNGDCAAFLQKAKSYAGDDCLVWPYATVKGYACIRINQTTEYVAPIVCEDANGPAPLDKPFALHSCDNGHGGCINPTHLRWGSPADNSREMAERGRSCKGMTNQERRHFGARKRDHGFADAASP